MNIIYNEVLNYFKEYHQLNMIRNRRLHLGVFKNPYLKLMLEGRKTIESRFSKHKTAPYNQITKDDIIIVKETSGQVIAFMEIQDVIFIDLKDTNTNDIKEKYQDDLCVDDDFWKAKKDSKYVTLIFIKKISLIEPFSITKKGMQSWIVLNNPL